MKKRVVITGMGVICPIGVGIEEVWENCINGRVNVDNIPETWSRLYDYKSKIWSPLPNINFLSYNLKRTELIQLDMAQALSLSATHQALEKALLSYSPYKERKNSYLLDNIKTHRIGVHIGTGIGGVRALLQSASVQMFLKHKNKLKMLERTNMTAETVTALDDMEKEVIIPNRFNPFAVAMSMPNACASRIGIKYNLMGSNITYCASCASGTIAIGKAYQEIQSGILDIAVTGGVEYLSDDLGSIFRGFDVADTLAKANGTPEMANRPFDMKRTGFLFAEGGCAIIILEELEHAIKRKAPIIAEITGYAESFDAFSIMSIEPNGIMIKNMINECLQNAHLMPDDIDYINAHGTGTEVNDQTEASIIMDIFGKKPYVNSSKSLIGHTIGASGSIEAVITALTINNKQTHICKNLEEPIADLNFVTAPVRHEFKRGLSQSFGFGGHNASLIIEEAK